MKFKNYNSEIELLGVEMLEEMAAFDELLARTCDEIHQTDTREPAACGQIRKIRKAIRVAKPAFNELRSPE